MAVAAGGPHLGASLDELVIPADLEAGEPPEARGLARDEVRLMVSHAGTDVVSHHQFRDLHTLLRPGDVLAINTSGTLNAAIPARDAGGGLLEVHLSTQLPGGLWTVEARKPSGSGTEPYFDLVPIETLELPAGGSITIHAPYECGCGRPAQNGRIRLWIATFQLPSPLHAYLQRHGRPIRYGYVREQWDSSYYQTVFATEMGSAEMPSAGRAFSADLIAALISRGVQFAPLTLHTGVASLESHEPPYEERYRVPQSTARLINAAHAGGSRVIAVGTTVVRALESVIDSDGEIHPGEGWTCVVVTPETDVLSVDGLLTGFHEPRSSHLMMLKAIAGSRHIEIAYDEALRRRYLWHEFGDEHLILA